MKKVNIFLWMFLPLALLHARTIEDSLEIRRSVLDYAEGFYSGDVVRMERALYPDINHVKPGKVSQAGNIALIYSTNSELLEAAHSGAGKLEEGKRQISINILSIYKNVANVKLVSAKFNDYVQLVKNNNRWKIINVLCTNGSDIPDKIKDFKPEQEKSVIKKTAEDYIHGIFTSDTKRLESVVHPEYNKVTLTTVEGSDKTVFGKQKYSTLIENSSAKLIMIDEPKWMIEVKVVDVMDGLALVEISTGFNYEYIQMFKSGEQWRIVNSIVVDNPKSSYYQYLPAIVGTPMPDFTLQVYGGGTFTLSEQKGKNVLLIFLRGSLGNIWCKICQYWYAELSELERSEGLRKKYNVEIVFVLPYSSEKISDFFRTIPTGLEEMEKAKNPGQDASLWQKEAAEVKKRMFPQKYEWKQKDISTSLPMLVDSERVVSKRLKLFTTHWDQINSAQNIPTTYIIDKNGIVAFKYHSQTTYDRPDWNYIKNILEKM
ncbi:MAG: nuclear transport factor 2 family protein [Bacteroidota bacterium]|jgi:peroxiredoxin